MGGGGGSGRGRCYFCNFCSLECFNCRWVSGGTWSKTSYLGQAEIAPFVFLVLFKDGGRRVSPRFLILFLMLINGMRRRG